MITLIIVIIIIIIIILSVGIAVRDLKAMIQHAAVSLILHAVACRVIDTARSLD